MAIACFSTPPHLSRHREGNRRCAASQKSSCRARRLGSIERCQANSSFKEDVNAVISETMTVKSSLP
eukprot:scaffold101553_cov30-Tisochrysis_lutea.AAC.4